MIFFHDDGSQQGRYEHKYKDKRDDVSFYSGKFSMDERHSELQPGKNQYNCYSRVSAYDAEQGAKEFFPSTFLLDCICAR